MVRVYNFLVTTRIGFIQVLFGSQIAYYSTVCTSVNLYLEDYLSGPGKYYSYSNMMQTATMSFLRSL